MDGDLWGFEGNAVTERKEGRGSDKHTTDCETGLQNVRNTFTARRSQQDAHSSEEFTMGCRTYT